MTPLVEALMVRLQKQVAYEYKGHKIYKYRVNVPSGIVESAKWDGGVELEFRVRDGVVEIRVKNQ